MTATRSGGGGGRAARRPEFDDVIATLRQLHGDIEGPPTSGPFEMILWENVAYLATPERRAEAFALLKRTIGTDPMAILAATREKLERVTGRGILKEGFAEKLRACASLVIEKFDGDLDAALHGEEAAAKRALRKFPGIGEPGAEKILLFAGRLRHPAPESNGLRVLVRIGLIPEERTYARTYAASRDVAGEAGAPAKRMQEAHLLLQEHGRTLCRRSLPSCETCPLEPVCAWAAASGPRTRSRGKARKRA